ncbi:hypothetical protein [Methylocapsa palsarum]|uniref:Uncharacterized protein n=1 Tax=Methylocapsa palsarum TaxID=1612308 RepID=A0A1I3XQH1_9HYPH|nr:hypothetical protein [Methylocapsa palsarum]SFK21733.1 hypothetical protein SAMN05444581_1042 [Methylocapsa palsarum]
MSKRPHRNHAPAIALAAIKGEKTLVDPPRNSCPAKPAHFIERLSLLVWSAGKLKLLSNLGRSTSAEISKTGFMALGFRTALSLDEWVLGGAETTSACRDGSYVTR